MEVTVVWFLTGAALVFCATTATIVSGAMAEIGVRGYDALQDALMN